MEKVMNIRKWNDQWKYWIDENAFSFTWDVPVHAKSVTLPHDAMIEERAVKDSPNGGNTGYRNGKNYVYVKKFYAPNFWEDQLVQVKFEGVYMNAMVYLNGQYITKCPYGYTTFYAKLNDYLKYGEENELRVLVKAGMMTNSRWYSGAGIYRDVYLMTSSRTHIIADGLQVQTEKISPDHAVLKLNIEMINEEAIRRSLRVKTIIKDYEGMVIKEDEAPVFLTSGNSICLSRRISIQNPHLWDEQSPYLYELETTLFSDGIVMDTDKVRFGIRTLSLDAADGLQINGKTVKLRGACIHHDNGLLGSAAYEEAQYREIYLLKKAGFNAVRMSHHPMAPAMLRACDELGMYVMDELCDMWNRMKSDFDYGLYFAEWWKKDAESMVRKDFNHPSVIMYSIGNEIPEIGSDEGSVMAYEISSWLHKLDNSRYTTAGINGIFAAGDNMSEIMSDLISESPEITTDETANVNDFMSVMSKYHDQIVSHSGVSEKLDMACAALDVAGYNYMTARYAVDNERYPNRIIVGSETYPPEIARNWNEVEKYSNVIGDFTWTGFDYIGEAGVGITGYQPGEGGFGAQFPAQLAYCGDLDLTGFRRPISYLREIVFGFRKEPYLAVQNPRHYGEQAFTTPWILSDSIHSWTWKGCEGKPVIVEVYAPGEEVELFQNNCSLGKKMSGKQAGYRILFETIYQPGELLAVVYDNGKEVSRSVLTTAGECKKIAVRKENPVTESKELIYLQIELQDENSQIVTDEDQEISLWIKGAKALIGSGDPKPAYNYSDGVTKTWNGRAQIILQSQNVSESIQLTLTLDCGLQKTIHNLYTEFPEDKI